MDFYDYICDAVPQTFFPLEHREEIMREYLRLERDLIVQLDPDTIALFERVHSLWNRITDRDCARQVLYALLLGTALGSAATGRG